MHQTGIANAEFIVSYDDVRDVSPELARKFCEVQFLHASGRRTFAELRALGIQHAHGDLIAITEDHCIPRTDWCAQIIQAHAHPYAAIGGAVESGAQTALSWAVYLCDYSRYMNPLSDGPSHQLTDCNVSYKRQALAA